MVTGSLTPLARRTGCSGTTPGLFCIMILNLAPQNAQPLCNPTSQTLKKYQEYLPVESQCLK